MKIFGKEFITKKQLENKVSTLEKALADMLDAFPLQLGQTVYDIQLRDESGRYTRKNASLEYSRINEVEVSDKNYFGLVDRYKNHDVFFERLAAEEYLYNVCTKK